MSGKPEEAGFTLVELMIVIAIVGIVSAAVVLAIPDPNGGLRDEGERFGARAHAARDLAITGARAVAIRVDGAGYAFELRREGEWRPLERRPFAPQRWRGGTEAALAGDGQGGGRIVFDATGLTDPARLTLARRGRRLAVAIGADGTVRVGG